MTTVVSAFGAQVREQKLPAALHEAAHLLNTLVEGEAYVGEVYSLGYDEALVQIHDHYRQRVGGIPALSFLVATRIVPGVIADPREEDSSIILLRVLDKAALPNDDEALRVRVENAQRVSGELDKTYDHQTIVDATTNHLLGYAGVKCRVLGTFYIADLADAGYVLSFGSDISNYYPNRGLKVFKPRGSTLEHIVNFRDPRLNSDNTGPMVPIGEVRYASTNRPYQGIIGVPVSINPTDLLEQKTALFGMTRSGKSNTTKIILKTVFELRWQQAPQRIGQIIFDPNGEYANENTQDADRHQNANAIKNVWACGPEEQHDGLRDDVVTYGITPHQNDPNRRLMLLNFYIDGNLSIGKQVIDSALADQSSTYLSNFRDVQFEPPAAGDHSATSRYNRRVLCYRALLFKAGLTPPGSLQPQPERLFGQDFIGKLSSSSGKDSAAYTAAATILSKPNPTWAEMVQVCTTLRLYINDDKSDYS